MGQEHRPETETDVVAAGGTFWWKLLSAKHIHLATFCVLDTWGDFGRCHGAVFHGWRALLVLLATLHVSVRRAMEGGFIW
jgi:hypothetical protein